MEQNSFDQSKSRLEEIATLVKDESISLDDALALYEEAVTLGMQACEVSEQDLQLNEAAEPREQSSSEDETSDSAPVSDATSDLASAPITSAPVPAPVPAPDSAE